MRLKIKYHTVKILFLLLIIIIIGCKEKRSTIVTPWGTKMTVDENGNTITDDTAEVNDVISNIKQCGELIMLTLSGPDTYYEYHGRGMGLHYLLCEQLAKHLGVVLRVDVCKDSVELITRLKNKEGDIIAYPMKKTDNADLISCCENWLVTKEYSNLADTIKKWYKSSMLTDIKQQQQRMLLMGNVKRHVYPMMLAPSKGQISAYDNLFRKYATTAGVDWVMLAAQCYQESCFDPKAHSWAGACGLMQIIPSTADHLSLPRSQMYEPEPNVAAAARLLRELQAQFKDISNPTERLKFSLAAYNAGYNHVRDAMALTKKYGGITQRWSDVRKYILLLSNKEYYSDPVVRYGYMRGSETANYVDMIIERHQKYREALRTGKAIVSTVKNKNYNEDNYTDPLSSSLAAHRASKKNKWRKD